MTTRAAMIVIGYTQSDRRLTHASDEGLRDYIPACDGYRDGAVQHMSRAFLIDCDQVDHRPIALDLIEGVFIATNAPIESARSDWRGRVVYDAMSKVGGFERAVSVGDTVRVVTVDDEQIIDETYACDRAGWTLIRKGE